jgi:hypothetical protein
VLGAGQASPGRGSRPAATLALILGYAANSGSHSVTPFDTSRGRPGQPIAVQGSPVGLLAQSDGHYVMVAGSAGVTPIGTHFNKAGPLIPMPGGAASMAFGYYLWVSAASRPRIGPRSYRSPRSGMRIRRSRSRRAPGRGRPRWCTRRTPRTCTRAARLAW